MVCLLRIIISNKKRGNRIYLKTLHNANIQMEFIKCQKILSFIHEGY